MARVLAALVLALPVAALAEADEPIVMTHHGRLIATGDTLAEGEVALAFSIWADPKSDQPAQRVWPASGTSLCPATARQGIYSVTFDGKAETGCGAGLRTNHLPPGEARYLEITVGSVALSPRLRLGTVPTAAFASLAARALKAGDADKLGGRPVSDFALKAELSTDAETLGGTPAGDYALKTDTAPDALLLGGRDPGEYALKTDTAPNALKLGNRDFGDYALKTDTAPNADRLGGFPAADYVRAATGGSIAGNLGITGNLGIGGELRVTGKTLVERLEAAGEIKVGNSSTACDASMEGALRYNTTTRRMEFCNRTAWAPIVPPDTTPAAFTFENVPNTPANSLTSSNVVTVADFDGPLTVSVSGQGSPELQINGGNWATSAQINPSNTLRLRTTAPATAGTTFTVTVTLGTYATNWTVTVDSFPVSSVATFTNCGQTGSAEPSPSQCASAYASTLLAGKVTVEAGLQRWVVPTTGTYRIDLSGAEGGRSRAETTAGKGGRVVAQRAFTAGDVLWIAVGQQGEGNDWGSSGSNYYAAGGFNGGGGTGYNTNSCSNCSHASGGGASDVRLGGKTLTERIIVAGGGGGGSTETSGSDPRFGGDGGGLIGQAGMAGGVRGASCSGRGGTQTAGGTVECSSTPGEAGALGRGGRGNTNDASGGGGGYYGGGGGGNNASGGGGSSYADGTFTNVVHTQGARAGQGVVTIERMP